MAAIGLDAFSVSQFLVDGVTIACVNSAASVTISGDLDTVRAVMATIESHEPDVLVRELKVNIAYHSGEWQSFMHGVTEY